MQTAAPTSVRPMVTAEDSNRKSRSGSVTIITAMPSVSRPNSPAQNQVAP